jgi:hypothetical protein
MGLRLPYTFAIAPSAARTTSYTGSSIHNTEGFPGVRVFIDVTADAGASESVTFSIQIQDPLGGDWTSILTSAAQTAAITAPVVLTVAPGCTTVANTTLQSFIGREFRLISTAANSDSLTWSAHGEWLGTVGG